MENTISYLQARCFYLNSKVNLSVAIKPMPFQIAKVSDRGVGDLEKINGRLWFCMSGFTNFTQSRTTSHQKSSSHQNWQLLEFYKHFFLRFFRIV